MNDTPARPGVLRLVVKIMAAWRASCGAAKTAKALAYQRAVAQMKRTLGTCATHHKRAMGRRVLTQWAKVVRLIKIHTVYFARAGGADIIFVPPHYSDVDLKSSLPSLGIIHSETCCMRNACHVMS
jgi:hypothetical protein